MPSASASHRRVEPSTSVNKNVTTPEGAAVAGADTPAESHTRHAPTSHIVGIRPPDTYAPRRGCLTPKLDPLLGLHFRNVLGDALCAER